MKAFLGLAVLSLSLSTFANTRDSKTIVYDGSQSYFEISLQTEKTHTEYRMEEVPSTCYEQQISGYTTSCIGGNYRPYPPGYPGNFPGGYYDPRYRYPQPGPYFGRSCVQTPIYRSVPYSCMKTVRTSYQVKDYDVDARVTIDVSKVSELAANEKINVVLSGELLTVSVEGSKKFFIVQNDRALNSQMEGGVKYMDAAYKLEMVEAAPVLDAIKMSKIKIDKGLLKFDLGPVADLNDLAVNLNIEKRKTGADAVLLNRDLTASELKLTSTRSGTDVEVDVAALGVTLQGGKFDITSKVSFKPRGTLLNRAEFPEKALSTSRTLIYTKR